MYHIVKDVASLITTSPENAFLTGQTFQTVRLNTAKLGQLTCLNLGNEIFVIVVRNCMKIPKYTLISKISVSNGGLRKIIEIYNDISLNITILNFETF